MALIESNILAELAELPVEHFDALEGKWPVPGGDFWDHRTDDGKRLCWEILANTTVTAPKVCDWLWAQEDLAGFRSSMDMKSAAAAYEKAMAREETPVARWSETAKARRAEVKATAEKPEPKSKAADTGKVDIQPEVEAPEAEAPKPKAGRKPRVKQTTAA